MERIHRFVAWGVNLGFIPETAPSGALESMIQNLGEKPAIVFGSTEDVVGISPVHEADNFRLFCPEVGETFRVSVPNIHGIKLGKVGGEVYTPSHFSGEFTMANDGPRLSHMAKA